MPAQRHSGRGAGLGASHWPPPGVLAAAGEPEAEAPGAAGVGRGRLLWQVRGRRGVAAGGPRRVPAEGWGPGGGAGSTGRCAFAGRAASLVVVLRRSPCARGQGTRWGRPGRGARAGLREGAAHGGTLSFLFPTRRTACLRKVEFQSKLAKSPGIA